MSTGQRSTNRSIASAHSSRPSLDASVPRHPPPSATLTPENADQEFEPCAATASYLLYAQRNVILVLHHDTLAIERRFELHREDVKWIAVDNVSVKGIGRLAVSYDTGNTAIVWDIFTGGEVSRFSAYDPINIACFMRNGEIAFGNVQGTIILFDPATSEHTSARTIFDPITALAPSADCHSFAIGYLNGSILIATIQPAFTIQHTLPSSRAPSKVAGLAWHGSSSKSKTDMLAAQTQDGDLRVWSVPKIPHTEQPMVIRLLNRNEAPMRGPNWFAWSKNGRIVQYIEGETRAWDVRTKKVTFDIIPTIEHIIGIAVYGPGATLFTLGRNHTVQQYDINPNTSPMQVQAVQHMPANTPPTPPTTLEERKNPYARIDDPAVGFVPILPQMTDNESSADEGAAMSPLEKIAREMDTLDAMESELRDKVMPLSPTSSRASSVSSKSSGRHFRQRKYLYDRPDSSRASSTSGYDGTEFSFGVTPPRGHESISIRSSASVTSNKYRSSNLRNQLLRSPQESDATASMDLFPNTKARLREVDFRTPHYGNTARTAEILRREMLSVVFGWNDDVTTLIRDELARHRPGSASGVLLSKWLGDVNADAMASMVGSESMTSSDWMLLALSSIQGTSQKMVGETFVQRLLEKGEIHPAVAILLGLNEYDDAIEVYVSQSYWMEALLLCALKTPGDWGRQSVLLRKWGEVAVQQGEPELAVRIFSCASVESSEPWFSPRAQDAVYTAQQQKLSEPTSAGPLTSPPMSPPSRSGSGRLTAKNASLKLITSFGDKGAPLAIKDAAQLAAGVTPIAESALSPRGVDAGWQRPGPRRDNSEVRTATPGGFSRRKRLPSRSDIERAKAEAAEMATPLTAARDPTSRTSSAQGFRSSRRTSSVSRGLEEPTTAVKSRAQLLAEDAANTDRLPSPSEGAFNRFSGGSRTRGASRERNPGHLAVQVVETRYDPDALSPGPATNDTGYTSRTATSRGGLNSPPLTGVSLRSTKSKAIDKYISSVEEARNAARQDRAESKRRGQSRSRAESRQRGVSNVRDQSEGRRKDGTRYIKPPKRSPSSPVPMSPEELASHGPATTDDEDFYRIASPIEPRNARADLFKSGRDNDKLQVGMATDGRGRTESRSTGSAARSPSTPLPVTSDQQGQFKDPDTESDGRRVRTRTGSNTRGDDIQTRRAASRSRARSTSRRPSARNEDIAAQTERLANEGADNVSELLPTARPRTRTREEAARELEERRLSLARRPSAPPIPLPADLGRPSMTPRSHTELTNSPNSYMPPFSRSHTVDPEAMARYGKITGTSTPSAPIGLPATPRAMRHPKYMGSNPDKDDTPPVPHLPEGLGSASGSGSLLSQVTGSNLSQGAPSSLSQISSSLTSDQGPANSELDSIGPLLPSSVYKGPSAPTRSASAPPEKNTAGMLPSHPAYKPGLASSSRRLSRGHVRKISPPDLSAQTIGVSGITSIDEALDQRQTDQIIIVDDNTDAPPVMLPELQHLAGPPPPPPPPTLFTTPGHTGSGIINIAIGTESAVGSDLSSGLSAAPSQFPQAMERATTASPNVHRRGRGSVGGDSFGQRMRGVADRMRSSSRSKGAKSPQVNQTAYKSLPYETILAHERRESISRAKSPYEQAMEAGNNTIIPPPPPPPAAPMDAKLNETSIPPRPGSITNGYRRPREIRANMPPEYTQAGAQGGFL